MLNILPLIAAIVTVGDTTNLTIPAVAAGVGVGAIAVALFAFKRNKDDDEDDVTPPTQRRH